MNELKLISLPKIFDKRGNLSVLESNNQIPFAIKTTYLIYDVPRDEVRGCHTFIDHKEMIIALSGSVDVKVFDGVKDDKFILNKSYHGLYIPNGFQIHMENFTANAVILVISNSNSCENIYIKN